MAAAEDKYQTLLEQSQLLNPYVIPLYGDKIMPTYLDSLEAVAKRGARRDLESADAARTSQSSVPPLAPVAQAQGAPAATSSAAAPAPTVDPSVQMTHTLADLMQRYGKESQEVKAAQAAALRNREALVRPAIHDIERQALSPQPPAPKMASEPPIPDVKPRPFLTAEGSTALQTVVQGIGTLVTSLVGLNAPIGALNALTGAMEGWADGDATRAGREFQKYEAEVAKMQRQNATAMQEWERARVERADDMGARQALLQARLAEAGLSDYAAQVSEKGFDRTGQLVAVAQQQLHNYQTYENKVLRDQISLLRFYAGEKHKELSDQLLRERIQASQSGHIPDQDLQDMARQYLRGDNSVKQNIGRGIQGPDNIARLNHFIYQTAREQGISPEEIAAIQAEFQGFKAGERTLGTRSANIELAVQEAQALIPALRQASNNLKRSDAPLLNRFLKSMNLNVPFDEDMNAAQVQFGVALNSFINVYARAISPSGVKTVSDTEHARQLLVDTWGRGAIDAGLDQLMIELKAAEQSPGKVRAQLRDSMVPKKETEKDKTKGAQPLTLDELLKKYQ